MDGRLCILSGWPLETHACALASTRARVKRGLKRMRPVSNWRLICFQDPFFSVILTLVSCPDLEDETHMATWHKHTIDSQHLHVVSAAVLRACAPPTDRPTKACHGSLRWWPRREADTQDSRETDPTELPLLLVAITQHLSYNNALTSKKASIAGVMQGYLLFSSVSSATVPPCRPPMHTSIGDYYWSTDVACWIDFWTRLVSSAWARTAVCHRTRMCLNSATALLHNQTKICLLYHVCALNSIFSKFFVYVCNTVHIYLYT
jgi:hypothetical protein